MGRLYTLSRPKQHVLLAGLLLNANRPVPVERIIDWLFGEQPPASAVANLRSYVSNLRRQLSGDGPDVSRYRGRIQSRSGCYLLHIDSGELDADVFEELVTQGNRAIDEGQHALAAERFTRALGLWRSDVVLDGMTLPDQLQAETARLERQRMAALESGIEARLALGQHRELVAELEGLTRRYPLREMLWRQRLLALFRSGNRTDALAAYHQAREVLANELGIDPDADLQRLHEQILGADSTSAVKVARTRLPYPAQLPTDLSTFTGRATEISRLRALAADGATGVRGGRRGAVVVSAIHGMAGVGKTALAIQVAHQLSASYPDGQVFIDLHGFTDGMKPIEPADALARLLRSMGVSGNQIPHTVEEAAALWRTCLADRRMLLVLDNAVDEAQVRPLLPGTPDCLVLVTSRRKLAGLDDVCPISLDILPLDDAVALFEVTAGTDKLAREPAGSNSDPITDVVELCGRLPLAIRIAAARLRHRPTWSVRHLVDRLRDRQHLLTELESGQQSVAAAIDLSYQHLTADQQRTFVLLGLHPGPDIDIHAVAALAEFPTVRQAERLLDELVDAHLLEQHQPGRYQFHDLVRLYVGRICADEPPEPDRTSALTGLLDYYRYTATRAIEATYPVASNHRVPLPAPDTPVPRLDTRHENKAWLDVELPNLLAAAQTAGTDWPEHTIHLSEALHHHLDNRARYSEAAALHTHALNSARAGNDRAGELSALRRLSYAVKSLGELKSAAIYVKRALNLAQEIGHRTEEMHIQNGAGTIHQAQGRYDLALDCFQRALTIAREIGHRTGEGMALRNIGATQCTRGEHSEAAGYFERALTLSRAGNDRVGEHAALYSLGQHHCSQGQYKLACECFHRALDIALEIGHRTGELMALHGLGMSNHQCGAYEQATKYCLRALDIARETNNRNQQLESLHELGNILHSTGRYHEALPHHLQALAIATALDQVVDQARARHGAARAHLALGQPERAGDQWRRALAILDNLGIDQARDITGKQLRAHLAALDSGQCTSERPVP